MQGVIGRIPYSLLGTTFSYRYPAAAYQEFDGQTSVFFCSAIGYAF